MPASPDRRGDHEDLTPDEIRRQLRHVNVLLATAAIVTPSHRLAFLRQARHWLGHAREGLDDLIGREAAGAGETLDDPLTAGACPDTIEAD